LGRFNRQRCHISRDRDRAPIIATVLFGAAAIVNALLLTVLDQWAA
jgi:hypothetical protein